MNIHEAEEIEHLGVLNEGEQQLEVVSDCSRDDQYGADLDKLWQSVESKKGLTCYLLKESSHWTWLISFSPLNSYRVFCFLCRNRASLRGCRRTLDCKVTQIFLLIHVAFIWLVIWPLDSVCDLNIVVIDVCVGSHLAIISSMALCLLSQYQEQQTKGEVLYCACFADFHRKISIIE